MFVLVLVLVLVSVVVSCWFGSVVVVVSHAVSVSVSVVVVVGVVLYSVSSAKHSNMAHATESDDASSDGSSEEMLERRSDGGGGQAVEAFLVLRHFSRRTMDSPTFSPPTATAKCVTRQNMSQRRMRWGLLVRADFFFFRGLCLCLCLCPCLCRRLLRRREWTL